MKNDYTINDALKETDQKNMIVRVWLGRWLTHEEIAELVYQKRNEIIYKGRPGYVRPGKPVTIAGIKAQLPNFIREIKKPRNGWWMKLKIEKDKDKSMLLLQI